MNVSVPFNLEHFKKTYQPIDRLFRYVREQALKTDSDIRAECEKNQFFANISGEAKRERFLLKAIDLLPKKFAQYKVLLILLIKGHPEYPNDGRWSHAMISRFFKVSIESVKQMERDALSYVQDRLSALESSGICLPDNPIDTVMI